MNTAAKPNHIGRKISRIRELRNMKQEALALELGVSQQTVSAMENKEIIERDLLEHVAKILGVTPEAIENFNEEAVLNFFNTFNDNSSNNGAFYAQTFNFNPIDKVIDLYERLIQAEREKIDYLESFIKKMSHNNS